MLQFLFPKNTLKSADNSRFSFPKNTLKSADATVFVSEKYAKKRGFWRLERGCIVLKSKNVYLPLRC
jgi:hypothetical protein